MPEIPINVLQSVVAVEQLCNEVAKLQKQLRYLVNGQIDFENVRARSIKAQNIETETLTANEIAANAITAIKIAAEAVTAAKIAAEAVEASKIKAGAVETDKLAAGAVTAEKITVAQLSAIAADLGHIMAGLIEAVTIIGSEIMTQAAGVYPRTELSTVFNLLKAEASASEYIAILANYFGAVRLQIESLNVLANIYPSGTDLMIATADSGIQISSGGDLRLLAKLTDTSKLVIINSWDRFYSQDDGETLQDVIDALTSRIEYLEDNAFDNAVRVGGTIEFDSKNNTKVDSVSIV